MKKFLHPTLLLCLLLLTCFSRATAQNGNSQYEPYNIDGIPWEIAAAPWEADLLGNQRAVVKVTGSTSERCVKVTLPWRRADLRPQSKGILVMDAQSGKEITNCSILSLTPQEGVLLFEPASGDGTYYIYYLPSHFRRKWDDARYGTPWNDYLPPTQKSNSFWRAAAGSSSPVEARVERFESRTRFDFFTPMGLIATDEESQRLEQANPQSPVLFPEDRAYPIRLTHRLPARWAQRGAKDSFSGQAARNEYYVWQIGVWAAHRAAQDIHISFSDLKNGSYTLSKDSITCFNQEGIGWEGDSLHFTINVPQHDIQALWCGVQIPPDAPAGVYRGRATLTCKGEKSQVVTLEIEVTQEYLADKGDGDLWRHARLRWLNSRIGQGDRPVAPYLALATKKRSVQATEKSFYFAPNGLPSSIVINRKEVLAAPFRFAVSSPQGEIVFNARNASFTSQSNGAVTWESRSTQEGLTFVCRGRMEFDGYVHYEIEVSSPVDRPVKDIRLENRYTPYASRYFMGAGYGGGKRPQNHTWTWEGPWDSYWMGNALAGLHVEYRGGSYHGPLLNDYKPLPPAAWHNGGRGTVSVTGKEGQSATVIASTGSDTLYAAHPLRFEFDLLITPVKPLNSARHFAQRYYHAAHTGFDKAAQEGANILNIHHAQPLNPVINYPFIVQDSLKAFIEKEHKQGRKVKLYYTIRELTSHAVEVYALKSLHHEIFTQGPGYGIPWLQEHLIDDYRPAWYTELPNETSDAALVLSGFSRWINYYLEGLRWMFENYHIDGIYMDDVSFDRPVMKRMRHIIEAYRPGALIDLHSNTGYSVGPANQYTGFFPYVDRLWFGESFQYNKMNPDEWFVTFSGIPFGMMSEMLQDGGNRFLGMVYGATARHSYGEFSPAPMWKLWKEFGIEQARMSGYWDDDCPIETHNEVVKATTYIKHDSTLIALGNFGDKPQTVSLAINWKRLGINPKHAKLYAPAVENFQEYRLCDVSTPITLEPKKGCLLILENE